MESVTKLFNKVWRNESILKDWYHAEIIVLYKKGDRTQTL